MAHELDNSKGIYAFAARGGAASAWHGLGQSIMPGDSISTITQKAGLDWSVQRAPVFYMANGLQRSFDNQSVLYRDDTGRSLGIVSDNRYNIVQPREVMEFFADFLSDQKLTMETAGAVRGGSVIWCMAKLGPEYGFLMPGNDKVDSYVRLQTSFDGSRATDLVATTVRQVCANTMRMANADADKNGFKVRHSSVFDSRALAKSFGLLGEQHRVTSEQWNELATRKVSDLDALRFFAELLELTVIDGRVRREDGEEISTKTKNNLRSIVASYRNAPGAQLASAAGTAYGLLNAVTHYVDHVATVRDTEKDGASAARFASSQLGSGDALKQKAMRKLVDQYQLVAA